MKQLIKQSVTVLAVLALLVCVFPAAAAAAEEEPLRIAFIDSGISTKHIDPARVETGKNYVFPEADTRDRIGHGTATASLVLGAAGQGVYGVYPDAVAVPLVVVDVYPSGATKNGGLAALSEAICDAVEVFHCQIINISLAVAEDSEALRDAVAHAERMGAVIVSVTGNDGEAGGVYYPADYETVISVGAADGENAAPFSQSGADVLAPGVGLTAATNKNAAAPTVVSGTSYSCALVSGICAKLRAAYPALSPAALRQGLAALAEDILEPGFDVRSGWGVVDPETAIPYPYLDVPADAWSYPAILAAAQKGLMNGTGSGMFSPDGAMTRAMFAALLWRLAGEPERGQEFLFTDVAADQWYTDAVLWAASEGMVEGCGDGGFHPDDSVSREQMVTMLWRFSGKIAAGTADLSDYKDADTISDWAEEAFAWAISVGLVKGKGDGILDPGGKTTRAEVAQIVMNYNQKATV